MTSRAWIFAFFAAAIAVPAACTFPTVTFDTGSTSSSGTGSNGGAGSGNPTSGGTNTTQNTGGVGPGGLGGAGGAGGMNSGGGVTTSGGGFGGSSSNPCPMAADPCDCDNDGHRRPSCPGDHSKPADDCADHDSRANPDQMKAQSTPINGPLEPGFTLMWDFNCDGSETPAYDVLKCNLGNCTAPKGWAVGTMQHACGDSGDLKTCTSGLGCTYGEKGNTVQPCL